LERDPKWDEKHVCLAMKRNLHCVEKTPTMRWKKAYNDMKRDIQEDEKKRMTCNPPKNGRIALLLATNC